MKKLIVLATLTLCAGACVPNFQNNAVDAAEGQSKGAPLPPTDQHWSYQGETGPAHWSEIEQHCDCDGAQQSPVNIVRIDVADDATLTPIAFHYSDRVKIHDVTNNGHSIQYNFERGDYMVVDSTSFNLVQIHFHEASEHTIDGIRFPLETHFVHQSAGGRIAVLAVLAREGRGSRAFDFLESYLPVVEGETKTVDAYYDLTLNLPDDRDYYTYEGSLTTPPCTEGIAWYVLKTPVVVSVAQVEQLRALMPHNNYRTAQPTNGRTVAQMPAPLAM
ncbi:MAG: carbonic anhydrase family protein [Catalinimonas sp.]